MVRLLNVRRLCTATGGIWTKYPSGRRVPLYRINIVPLINLVNKCIPLKFVRDCFEDLKNQEAGRAKNGRLESGPGQFGVVRRVTAEEDTMENNTMYSCGSLAPKMKATVLNYSQP